MFLLNNAFAFIVYRGGDVIQHSDTCTNTQKNFQSHPWLTCPRKSNFTTDFIKHIPLNNDGQVFFCRRQTDIIIYYI